MAELKLNPQQRHFILVVLTTCQEPGTWQQKAVALTADGRPLIVERARFTVGVSTLDVGRAIDLETGLIETAHVKPSALPDVAENWTEFRLST